MRFPRSVFAVLAVLLVAAAARPASAQQQYVSCVKCHALPQPQATANLAGWGQTQGHGFSSYPPLEMVCQNCHDTYAHEQNPEAPPNTPFFLSRTGSSGSRITDVCLSCHAWQIPFFEPLTSHPYDVIPYIDTQLQPPPATPTSVLPLFNFQGAPFQEPYIGGLVCTTCHDPHVPAYPVLGRSKFLRIGHYEDTSPLCGYCHVAEATPPTTGYDLVIPSRTDSVRFQTLPYGDFQIDVTVRNRGNVSSGDSYADVTWENALGWRLPIGSLSIPPIGPDQETVVSTFWLPPTDWVAGDGSFHFQFPPQPLLDPAAGFAFVRAMDVTPAPTHVRVLGATAGEITLAWDAPANPPIDLGWDVYRDGVKITPTPIHYYPYPQFTDVGLAPETPHVYTVVAVRMLGGLPSQPSDPVGATTAVGGIIRVPQQYQTIQAAIDAAGPGTSIHVAPGTYAEPIFLGTKSGITIKGQDANGCVLDYTALPSPAPIDLGYGDSGNTLAGFTIRNNTVGLQAGDVVTECVIVNDSRYTGPAVVGGGLVAQCVVDTQDRLSVVVPPVGALTSVNSIYLSSQPFSATDLSNGNFLLLNNDFPYWPGYWNVAGSDNFPDQPLFDAPGAPFTYRPAYSSPTNHRGFPLEDPYFIPDVGAFQAAEPYTPQRPSDLTAELVPVLPAVAHLQWEPSVDDPGRMMDYFIYRSTAPAFEVVPTVQPYAMVPAGTYFFEDFGIAPNVTYYYQVRAYGGDAVEYPHAQLISAPTGTVSVTWANNPPVAVNDAFSIQEDQMLSFAPGGGVLVNDTDADGDPLQAIFVAGPAHGSLTLRPDGSFTYYPAPDYNGPDSFSYRASDGQSVSAVATVAITVTPYNDPPRGTNDAYATAEDTVLAVAAPGVLANDSEVDGDFFQPLLVSAPQHGTLHYLFSSGAFSYTPAANFNGSDSFTYRLFDGTSYSTPPTTVTITVTPVNDAPTPAPDSYTTPEDTALVVAAPGLLANDSDPDGDPLGAVLAAGPQHGTLALNLNGSFTYTPAPGFNGTDTFTYTAGDLWAAAPATVTITVTPVNDAPIAAGGDNQAGIVGQILSFSGAASTDVDGTIVAYAWNWGDGTATGSGVSASHAWTAAGTYTVTLSVTDDIGATATDTLTVTVNPAPVNLALNKTASASSTRKGGYAAANAVDGSPATSWMSSKSSTAQWVRVDLGAATSISNVKVAWPATYFARAFKIETSTDAKKWDAVYSSTAGNGTLTDATFAAKSARYVRVSCTTPNSPLYYGVAELEVYQ